MKNQTWQNPEQLFVAQVLIKKVKLKCCGIWESMEDYLAILQALKWAASRCKYSNINGIGIKRLQEVYINFATTPASNIEPFKYKASDMEMLSLVFTGYYQSNITITPALPFVVYMYDGESLFGTESNCSQEVIKFLQSKKQIRTISFNAHNEPKQGNKVCVRNKMSVRELIVKQQSQLNFIENTGSQRLHFTCGSIKGYVSPAASKHVEQGKIDDFWYCRSEHRG